MTNEIEQAIINFTNDRTAENLALLEQEVLVGTFVVPVSQDVAEFSPGLADIPAICFKRSDGAGVLPVFTSVGNLLSWKPRGCKYVELQGRSLLEMAWGMLEIEEVAVNPDAVPRGSIPRSEFERLLSA